ncbi:Hypothetical predicted protein [Cloeon dipterum]|uniref:Uncharacterized protein n=1 Tax=Cloeon dipterum TaxID=197152 RepID=A0A8S1CAF1_9INSE|nr:Hypothetical predicted protein [Cloeon dipterum]
MPLVERNEACARAVAALVQPQRPGGSASGPYLLTASADCDPEGQDGEHADEPECAVGPPAGRVDAAHPGQSVVNSLRCFHCTTPGPPLKQTRRSERILNHKHGRKPQRHDG